LGKKKRKCCNFFHVKQKLVGKQNLGKSKSVKKKSLNPDTCIKQMKAFVEYATDKSSLIEIGTLIMTSFFYFFGEFFDCIILNSTMDQNLIVHEKMDQ
jgi:hypothetical protein